MDSNFNQYLKDSNDIKWLIRPPFDGVNEASRHPTFSSCVRVGGIAGPFWCSGAGAPAMDGPIGSLYSRTDGTATTSLYVKTVAGAGAGNWTAK